MGKPLVSIALALYNGEKYIAEQLKSILAQTYRELEIVVVDDASSDRSLELVRSFSDGDSRVRVYKNEKNLGLVHNFLKAVSFCQGEYVGYSDQDDIWREDKVEILSGVLSKNPKNMLVYSDLELPENDPRSFWKASKIRPKKGYLGAKAILRNVAPGCAMMFRRSVADLLAQAYLDDHLRTLNVGSRLDDVVFMHDQLAFAIGALLGRVDYSREKLVRYRQHDSNTIGAFYRAETSKSHFIEGLRRRSSFLRHYPLIKNNPDLIRMDYFADSLEKPEFIKTWQWWPYYLCLRNDTFFDQVLGWFECLFPYVYKRVKNRLAPSRVS